jgi:hypothetical protein
VEADEEEEEEEEDEEKTWVAIEKKRLAANKRKRVEAKNRNQQTKVFVRQLLKKDKAGKLDSFKYIASAKKKGAKEEEEEEEEEVVVVVVDSKRTKMKMDLGTGPSNAGPANLGPVAPPAIEAPLTLESSGNSSEGSS